MADISMCQGTACPSKDTCYRYTATPHTFWQPYSDFYLARSGDNLKCSHYWLTPAKENKS